MNESLPYPPFVAAKPIPPNTYKLYNESIHATGPIRPPGALSMLPTPLVP